MENVNETSGRPASTRPGGPASATSAGAEERPPQTEGSESDSSIWEELRARQVKASRRIGESWERVSETARDYADDHSIGVALGTLGVGVALGVLIGMLIGRD